MSSGLYYIVEIGIGLWMVFFYIILKAIITECQQAWFYPNRALFYRGVFAQQLSELQNAYIKDIF